MTLLNTVLVTLVSIMFVGLWSPAPSAAQASVSHSLRYVAPKPTPYAKHANSVKSRLPYRFQSNPTQTNAVWSKFPFRVVSAILFRDHITADEIMKETFGIGGGGGDISLRTSTPTSSCNQQAQCKPISQCPDYLHLVQDMRNPRVSSFLRSQICRLDVRTVLICCPDSSSGGFVLGIAGTTIGGASMNPAPSRPSQSRPSTSNGGTQVNFNRPVNEVSPFRPRIEGNIPVTTTRTTVQPMTSAFTPNSQDRTTSTAGPLPQGVPNQQLLPFGPPAIHRNRTSNVPQDEFSSSHFPGRPSIIPTEAECGSSDLIAKLRRNSLSYYPWLAAVGYKFNDGKFEPVCGGAIITRKHIIVASHCLQTRSEEGTPTHVRVGDYILNQNNDVANPQDFVIFNFQSAGFDSKTFEKNLAIISLNQEIIFNEFTQPLCLPYRFEYDGFRYQNLQVVGWSRTSLVEDEDEQPITPVEFASPVIGISDCRNKYKETSKAIIVNRNNMCLGGVGRKGCLWDQSSLGVYLDEDSSKKYFLVGLSSFGFGCDKPEEPYVFTRIGAYLKWIEDFVSKDSSTFGL